LAAEAETHVDLGDDGVVAGIDSGQPRMLGTINLLVPGDITCLRDAWSPSSTCVLGAAIGTAIVHHGARLRQEHGQLQAEMGPHV
jgi:hypothetical protein